MNLDERELLADSITEIVEKFEKHILLRAAGTFSKHDVMDASHACGVTQQPRVISRCAVRNVSYGLASGLPCGSNRNTLLHV